MIHSTPSSSTSLEALLSSATTSQDRASRLVPLLASHGVHLASPNTTVLTTSWMQPYMVYNHRDSRPRPLAYDRVQTASSLARALQFLMEVVKERGHILVVTGSPESTYVWSSRHRTVDLESFSSKGRNLSRFYKKWPGGLMSNYTGFLTATFPFVDSKGQGIGKGPARIRYELKYGGMKPRTRDRVRPDVVIFLNSKVSNHGILECSHCGVPSIGFIAQDCSKEAFDHLDYRIPGNLDGMEIACLYSERLLWAMTLGLNPSFSATTSIASTHFPPSTSDPSQQS